VTESDAGKGKPKPRRWSKTEKLDVDEDVATILVQEASPPWKSGYLPQSELANIESSTTKWSRSCATARAMLLTQAIASEETLDAGMPADDLLLLEGMTRSRAGARTPRRPHARRRRSAVKRLLDIEGLTSKKPASSS
jgi:hypothetical protein